MMFYTHLAFGLLVSLITINFFDTNIIIFVPTILFFSIFPDIDKSSSKIGQKHKFLSKAISIFFGHRGIFHTIYIPLLLFLTLNILNAQIAFAALIGYFSHLFLDAMTISGIRPLQPLVNKKIRGPFKTSSISEKIIFLVIIMLNFYILTIYI